MTRIPTKLERAQLHALYAPAGALRDEADKQLEIETEKRLKRMETPSQHHEEDLQIACCKFLDLHPRILYWATPNHLYGGKNSNTPQFMNYMQKQKRMGLKKGVSDLLMFFDGKFVAAELKVPPNKIKDGDDQDIYIKEVQKRGGIGGEVTSIDDLRALLKLAGYKYV